MEMNGKQETREINEEEFRAMTPEAQNNVLLTMTKIRGTVVVRRADGTIKYDDDAIPGTYGEESV